MEKNFHRIIEQATSGPSPWFHWASLPVSCYQSGFSSARALLRCVWEKWHLHISESPMNILYISLADI